MDAIERGETLLQDGKKASLRRERNLLFCNFFCGLFSASPGVEERCSQACFVLSAFDRMDLSCSRDDVLISISCSLI